MKPYSTQKPDPAMFELHAEVCKTFSHAKRLQIIEALGNNELTVSAIVERLGVPKANVSQHLAALRQRKVVVTRRAGLNVYYRIANPKIIKACNLMRQVLLEQLQAGQHLANRLKAK